MNFAGSYSNFTHLDFAESAIKLYKNEKYWNECLKLGHETIFRKFNENRVERSLRKALVRMQMAVYEGRGKGVYEEEWKRYTRSS